MKARFVGVTLLCLMLILVIGLPYARSQEDAEIVAPLAKQPASADGFIAKGEYDDAQVVLVGETKENYGYLFVKHNWTVLWVYLDYVTDKKKNAMGWDNGWVAIDKNMDRASTPQADDFLFHEAGHGGWIGDGVAPIPGSQWGQLLGHGGPPPEYQNLSDFIAPFFAGSGPSFGPTEVSDTSHAYCELQIPLNWLEDASTFGFAASMQDQDTKTIIDWPETKSNGEFWPGPDDPSEGNYMPPSDWGTLTLSSASLDVKPKLPPPPGGESTEIPYLYIIIAVIGVVVVASVVVFAMRRRK